MTDQQHLETQQNIVSVQCTIVNAQKAHETSNTTLQVVPVCLGVLRWFSALVQHPFQATVVPPCLLLHCKTHFLVVIMVYSWSMRFVSACDAV